MTLLWGPPSEDPDFHPEADGWNLFREPDPRVSPLVELPVSLGLGAGSFWLIREFHGFAGMPGNLLAAIPLLILAVIVHELVHALGHPGWGWGRQTRFGVWVSRLAFYSRYEGALPRNRRLLITVLPALGLSCTPVAILILCRWSWWPLSLLAVGNALFSARDLLNAAIILRQAPAGAILRDHGWKTYWKRG